ncbi:hypothetical protein M9Y10_006433 [Tritrichomonas musculus]|uniref:RING-type domain-containing protein n=1 Tax=Tritrichomonas musculus TaxID=1915356 RepID=A0ABR2JER8_9EUKA
MSVEFSTLLDESNSIRTEGTREITLICPILQSDEDIEVDLSYTITSNCNTVIKCKHFNILSSGVKISNVSFECAVTIRSIEDCTITNATIKDAESSNGALTISDGVNVTLSHLTISDAKEIPGIYISENSVVLADNLHVHDLADTLVVVKNGSFVTVTDSNFHDSSGNGFYVYDQSSIEISNCKFSKTVYSSIFATNSQSVVRKCEFKDIKKNGVSIESTEDFLIEKNHFYDIEDTAIRIFSHSTGVVDGNKIHNLDGNGINCNESKVTIKNNELFDLLYPAIAIISNSTSIISGNIVNNIKYSGIVARGAKDVKIEGSKIKDVKESGISISDTLKAVILNNEIDNCEVAAIEGYNSSVLSIYDNNISNIRKYAFLVFTSGIMEAKNNKIDHIGDKMVKLAYKGGGEFYDNQVENCEEQCDCQTTSNYFFKGNGQFKGVTNDPTRVQRNIVELGKPFVDTSLRCLKCNEKQRDHYLLDCGHKVYCKECAMMAHQNKENCPLCRFPITGVSGGFGVSKDEMCIICFENKADSIILPCGHMGVCSVCLENWYKNKKSCPICRTEPCFYKKIINDI